MKNKKEELLADFLEDNLSENQKHELEILFADNIGLKQEFVESKEIYDSIIKPPNQDFDFSKDKVFYDFLQEEKNKNNEKSKTINFYERSYFKYAATFAGLFFAFWFGRQTVDNQGGTNIISESKNQNIIERIVEVPVVRVDTLYIVQKQNSNIQASNVMNEIGNLKKEMKETKDLLIVSMLKRESASERIQAVNYSYDLQRPDEKVLKALIYTLDYDKNINVRLAAADAIGRFGYDDFVRDALVKSLLKQQEPTLQITIIETLTKLNVQRALPAFKLLAEDDRIIESVRQKAEEGTKLLSL